MQIIRYDLMMKKYSTYDLLFGSRAVKKNFENTTTVNSTLSRKITVSRANYTAISHL